MALIKCSECGKKMSNNAVSCPHCGNPNVAAPAAPKNSEETPAPAPKERRSHKKVILVVSIVLVLCLAAGGVWAAAKLPTMLAHEKLQRSWYCYIGDTTSKTWLTFDGTGSAVCEYDPFPDQGREKTVAAIYPYELLSPTQLFLDEQTYEIQFGEDGTLIFTPPFYGDAVWR